MKINHTFLLMMALLGCVFSQDTLQCQQSRNLIANGEFSQNSCTVPIESCTWSQSSFQPAWLPSWTPLKNGVQVGKGNNYNKVFNNVWVVNLDASINSCLKQKILNASDGFYTLEYDWAVDSAIYFNSATFTVAVNGLIMSYPQVRDYQLQHEIVNFQLLRDQNEIQIIFCGTGVSDAYGASITNVKLAHWDCN